MSGQFAVGNNDKLQCEFSYRPGHVQENVSLDLFKALFEKLCQDESVGLPVFAYYGVNRAVTAVPLRGKVPQGNLAAYKGALGQSTFRSFFEWLRAQEDIEIEEREVRQDPNYQNPALRAVRTAIYAAMPAISDLKVFRSPLRLSIEKNRKRLFVEHLSDGVGRLLRATFPNIQFILTTQSPMVLGEIGKDYNVFRVFDCSGRGEVESKNICFCDANMTLEREMGVSQINPAIKKLERLALRYALAGESYLMERTLERLNTLTCQTSDAPTAAAMVVSQARKQGKPTSAINLVEEEKRINGIVAKLEPIIPLPQDPD